MSKVYAEDNCIEPTTQITMNVCAWQDFEDKDAKLNVFYKKQANQLDKKQLERLMFAQRAWIKFRDTQCDYEAGFEEGGTIQPLIHSNCLSRLTDERIKYFKYIEAFWGSPLSE